MSASSAVLRTQCLSRSSLSDRRVPRRCLAVRAQKVEQTQNGGAAVLDAGEARVPSPAINVITTHPVPKWPEGIPFAMGGHYMPSGAAAPLSQSKGPGIDIHPLMFNYPTPTADVAVTVYESGSAAAAGLADMVAAASAAAISQRGAFTIALSGGSLVQALAGLVGRSDVDFSKWWVLWVDERNVPLSSDDSNYRAAHDQLLSKVPVPASQVLAIKEGLPVSQAAIHYAGQMLELSSTVLPRTADSFPIIDLVLLGAGPDGHVASLFPNRSETAVTEGWVLPVSNSPKPPSDRITLTLPVLNAAQQVAVVALGKGKAEVVQRALEVQSLPGALPVQMVQPTSGKLTWLLDQESASALRPADWALGSKKFPRSENPPKESA